MKKIYLLLFGLICFFASGSVSANTIESINTTVHIDDNGNGYVTEVWEIDADEGTESYHSFGNLDDRSITNLSVSMDGRKYTSLSSWDVDASKSQKAYKSGINYTDNGLELCWGIEYGMHEYVVNYTINNLVWQYDDNQILYFAFLPQNMDPSPDQFSLVIESDKEFYDLKYSSYGFDSQNTINDGRVYFTSNGSMTSDEYVVALVGFPNGTFNNLITKSGTYDDVADEAMEGATLNESDEEAFWVIPFCIILFLLGIPLLIYTFVNEYRQKPRNDKTDFIIPKEINNFRDIPFNKDILEAYYIGKHENIMARENLMGSILLKWLKEKKIEMVPTEGGLLDFNKNDNYYIDITNLTNLSDSIEKELCEFMQEAVYMQKDVENKKITPKAFKKWSRDNYTRIESWLDRASDHSLDKLINSGYIEKSEEYYNKRKTKTREVYKFTSRLADEFIKLKGLKQFLEDMTLIDQKKAIEVHLWDEYLIFAESFGIADKVAKQFKDFHPTEYNDNLNYYNGYILAHHFSTSSMNAVSAASAAASSGGSFSGGGTSSGGFSSGGGGVR